MKKVYIVLLCNLLVGYTYGVNYPTYVPDYAGYGQHTVPTTSTYAPADYGAYSPSATMPQHQFGSTSSMATPTSGYRAISSAPAAINSDGIASSPRRLAGGIMPLSDDDDDDDNIWTPGGSQTNQNQVPLGDGSIVLLLLAVAFAIRKAYKKTPRFFFSR